MAAVAKKAEEFRVYDADAEEHGGWAKNVYDHYKMMRANQCVAFVDRLEAKWLRFDHARMSIRAAFEALKGYVDSSDPDTELPNMDHMLQAAEGARAAGAPDWLQLVALIHDMGKIMYRWGSAEDGQSGTAEGPQFALGGDTWVVGCAIPECTVLPHLNALNPDKDHAVYGTPNGGYAEGCGVMNLRFAFGHDEYIYRWALHNKVPLPAEGLAMLRLHSCYPWHRGGAYRQFMAPGDDDLLRAVLDFNKFDLYTKSDARPDAVALWPHYQAIIDKYCPGELDW